MKPSIPQGTRDFGPEKMAKRNYIFDIIKTVFKRFGFEQIETPTLENLSVLMGKYGEEGDQLLFKVLNSGDFLSKSTVQDFEGGSKKMMTKIAEKGLRYDLTVPFARYVVMNHSNLPMPFKRYQIQPVWRADRPQKGRYREFYQCDADVVGTDSLICEAEIIAMVGQVMNALKVPFSLKINNRKVLTGMAEALGEKGKEGILAVAIDKLDKVGIEKVNTELSEKGISAEAIAKLPDFLEVVGSNTEKLDKLAQLLSSSEEGLKGIQELRDINDFCKKMGVSLQNLDFDPTLARGLSYYTGAIFEVKALGVSIGSITGGGRYDNLTGTFGMPGLSGVGISFGVDRIYDVLEELELFPNNQTLSTQVLFCYFDEATQAHALSLLMRVRAAGLNAEIYPTVSKLKKQLDYANRKAIAYAIIIGSDEMESGLLTVKNLYSGEQQKSTIEDFLRDSH
jgi:histidyl-tRNA synthetase